MSFDRLDRIQFTGFESVNGGAALEFEDVLITQVGNTARIQLDLDRNGQADALDMNGDGTPDTLRINLLNTDAGRLDAFDFVL